MKPPEGWVLVPVKPTPNMLEQIRIKGQSIVEARLTYADMLSVVPEAPTLAWVHK